MDASFGGLGPWWREARRPDDSLHACWAAFEESCALRERALTALGGREHSSRLDGAGGDLAQWVWTFELGPLERELFRSMAPLDAMAWLAGSPSSWLHGGSEICEPDGSAARRRWRAWSLAELCRRGGGQVPLDAPKAAGFANWQGLLEAAMPNDWNLSPEPGSRPSSDQGFSLRSALLAPSGMLDHAGSQWPSSAALLRLDAGVLVAG